MSSLSNLVLLHADDKAAAALRFGFGREGTQVERVDSAKALELAITGGSQLVITGGCSKKEASDQLALVKEAMESVGRKIPVLYFGNAISRQEAMDEGANEFLGQPAFLRDVITLSKLMATPTERRTQSISGELSEHFGLFYFVRALGMIRYNGVLTLIRGLRRGELRFYEGEATSAQLGGLHGLAALHQMLLWTNARFDLREENVVRRRQIPLEQDEVLRDCEKFLGEIREIAGVLSPSAVLEADGGKDSAQLPKQVKEVLRLFNGTSSVADVIEDSPYQNFETLRIACRLTEQGYIRRSSNSAPKHLMHTVLAIEEWLVGGELGDLGGAAAGTNPSSTKGKPISPPERNKGGSRKKKRGNRRTTGRQVASTEKVVVRNEQSWSDVLPSPESYEEFAQVVPATAAMGEISIPSPSSRAALGIGKPEAPKRERLEEKMESLVKIFVDEDLTEEPGKPSDDVFSWEEETSPATRLAMGDLPPDVEAEVRTLVNNWDTDTAGFTKKQAEVTSKSASKKPMSKSNKSSSPKADAKKADAKKGVTTISAYDPEEVAAAHTRVHTTARDASSAYSAAKGALAFKYKEGALPAVTNSKTAASKVMEVASSAESASTEATDFSVEEEDFFSRGVAQAKAPVIPAESFEDLDEEYDIPKTFWGRFMSDPWRDKRKKKD